jgi:tetratricopeptide (TPR) repeat protein
MINRRTVFLLITLQILLFPVVFSSNQRSSIKDHISYHHWHSPQIWQVPMQPPKYECAQANTNIQIDNISLPGVDSEAEVLIQLKALKYKTYQLINDLLYQLICLDEVRSWFNNGLIWIICGLTILLFVFFRGLFAQGEKKAMKREALDEDFDFLNSSEGLQSKMHLAGAFARIGKYEEAKKIYREIVIEGDQEQVKFAKSQLKKLG